MMWIDYDQHARTRPRNDFWGQVRRTVNGRPVAPEQIDLIVDAMLTQLDLAPGDVLLDIACGNGALTNRLQPYCSASLGIDISPYLIEIAQEHFADGSHEFCEADAASWSETAIGAARFTKALCYGSLSYLADADVARLLRALHQRFPNLDRVVLGNLPDPGRAAAFHAEPLPTLDNPSSAIGVWRSPARIAELSGPSWCLGTSIMPPEFFAAHYRFDAVLARVP